MPRVSLPSLILIEKIPFPAAPSSGTPAIPKPTLGNGECGSWKNEICVRCSCIKDSNRECSSSGVIDLQQPPIFIIIPIGCKNNHNGEKESCSGTIATSIMKCCKSPASTPLPSSSPLPLLFPNESKNSARPSVK